MGFTRILEIRDWDFSGFLMGFTRVLRNGIDWYLETGTWMVFW